MAIAAGHTGPVMDVRQHLQPGFPLVGLPALVAHVVLAGGASRVIPAGVVTAMTVLTIADCRLCGFPKAAMTIGTTGYMARDAVFIEEAAVHPAVAALHKALFSQTGGHGLIKDTVASYMAVDAPGCALRRCIRHREQPSVAQVAEGAGKNRVHRLAAGAMTAETTAGNRNLNGPQQTAGGDEGHHPAHDNPVLSGRSGLQAAHGRAGRG